MHCLNLKITYECTNQCSFCFSSYMKDNIISIESLKNAVVHGYDNGCNELVLSGGEPTLHPEYIIELILLAEDLGYKKYIIQTNGYGISKYNELLQFLNQVSQNAEVCLSFSVHGHSAIIHDDLSCNKGAFNILLDAIEKVSKSKCIIYTNTVINARNILFLKDIAEFLNKYNPQIMQFSIMHLKEPSHLSVSLKDSVQAIKSLRNIVDLNILKTEGVPYCLLHGLETCVGESAWPSVLDLYNKENDYKKDFKQMEFGMRKKMEKCCDCIMNHICMGVWKEHFEEFLSMRIHPIK